MLEPEGPVGGGTFLPLLAAHPRADFFVAKKGRMVYGATTSGRATIC